jgi:hypothetical protein
VSLASFHSYFAHRVVPLGATIAVGAALLTGCSYLSTAESEVTEPAATHPAAVAPTAASDAISEYGNDADWVLDVDVDSATWDYVATKNCSKVAEDPDNNSWFIPSSAKGWVDGSQLIAYSVAVAVAAKCPETSVDVTEAHPEFVDAITDLDESLSVAAVQPSSTPAPPTPSTPSYSAEPSYRTYPSYPSSPTYRSYPSYRSYPTYDYPYTTDLPTSPSFPTTAPVQPSVIPYGGNGAGTYAVPCADGSVSQAGGHQGACSHHGGTY